MPLTKYINDVGKILDTEEGMELPLIEHSDAYSETGTPEPVISLSTSLQISLVTDNDVDLVVDQCEEGTDSDKEIPSPSDEEVDTSKNKTSLSHEGIIF